MKKNILLAVLAASILATGCSPTSSDRGATDSSSASTTGNRQSDVSASANGPNSGPAVSDKLPDNTGVNKRDRSDTALTSGDQGNSQSDREITRAIRRAITKNDQLSTTAKNIKIITANGKTTLRGPVKTTEEKEQIVTAAKGVQGVGEVTDQLEVKNQTEKTDQ